MSTTAQARTASNQPNALVLPYPRAGRENNMAWGERAVTDMQSGGGDNWTYIVLLGGDDTTSFRVRLAQAHLRRDMLPSYWSHAMLAKLTGDTVKGALAIHIPLDQPGPPTYPRRTNGVVETPIEKFANPNRYPNIALIALPVPQAEVLEKIERFKESRGTLDALEFVLRWLAFCWGAARPANTLLEGYGTPSSCMLEIACAAARFDLTPGLEARIACPEAIWAAALHWQEFYRERHDGRVPLGRYSATHGYPIFDPDDPGPNQVLAKRVR
jgi:hypothetical protein